MKNCYKCKQNKPLTEFHDSPSAKDGKQSYCKKCCFLTSMESKMRNGGAWYMVDGYPTEWEHFNAALDQYAKVFDMPQLTRYKVSGSLKAADLKYKPIQ